MKTFKEFLVETDIRRQLRSVSYGTGVSGRQPTPFIQTHPARSLTYAKSVMPQPTMPNSAALTIGLGLGQVLAKGATALAKQRRQAQQQRLNQLVPGTTSVSGKPAQIKPLNK